MQVAAQLQLAARNAVHRMVDDEILDAVQREVLDFLFGAISKDADRNASISDTHAA